MRPDLRHFTGVPRKPPLEDVPHQLRGLPAEIDPPYDWAEFKRRSEARRARRASPIGWRHAAAAAGVTALVASVAMLASSGGSGDGTPRIVDATPVKIDATPVRSPASVSSDLDATREWLARQPAEPAVVRIGPRMAVASLEDRIAWFDDALTAERLEGPDSDRVRVLQQERARLVSSLAQVRYAESLMAGGS